LCILPDLSVEFIGNLAESCEQGRGAKTEAPNVPIGEHRRSEVEVHGAERVGGQHGVELLGTAAFLISIC